MDIRYILIKKIFFLLIVLIGFIACSKSTPSVFNGDSLYKKGLEYTQIGNIVSKLETKAIINATYLNRSDPKLYNNNYQNFLVGIYNIDENKNYKLTLNNKDINSSIKIDKKDEIYNNIPLKNPHANYYIVSFSKVKDETTLNLIYTHPIYGKVTLPFVAE